MADAGEILAGPIGREVLGAAQVIFLIFSCGGHVLTGMIAFDTSEPRWSGFWVTDSHGPVTEGASCSVLWAGVSAIICLVLTIPRTLDRISYLSAISFVSIAGRYSIGSQLGNHWTSCHWELLASVLITMIGVGVNGHTGTVSVTSKLSYANGFLAVSDIVCVFFAPNFPRVIINLPLHIDLCIFWHVIAHL